jgi:hypothetical protein
MPPNALKSDKSDLRAAGISEKNFHKSVVIDRRALARGAAVIDHDRSVTTDRAPSPRAALKVDA